MISDITSITRTAAVIYADDSLGNRKTKTIRRKFIESVFVLRENKSMTISTIVDALEEELSITFSDEEILSLVDKHENFEYIAGKTKAEDSYRLEANRLLLLRRRGSDVIQNTYEKFLLGKDITTEKFAEIMQKYLYYLLNTNIEAFSGILNGAMPIHSNVSGEPFEAEDIQMINEFLNWNDNDKNVALYKLISCCIEYAIAVNNSKESILTSAIKNKDFYLDNSLLYRALGINGEQRKKRTISFLKKCQETGQTLHVTCISRHEFMETIDFHINQLRSTTPFGNINPAIFRKIQSGCFSQYYHEWRTGKVQYGFELFKSHIVSAYNNLVQHYNIQEEFSYPFPEDEEIAKVEEYKNGIKGFKTWNGNSKSEALHLYDAQNIYWIEQLRGNNNKTVEHTKYYFITSDLKLHAWDAQHAKVAQPVTLQPSQWMALLLKYTTRSTDDFNSFVSFLNIPHDQNIVSESDLQLTLAGISEITENLQQQEAIVSNLFASNLKALQDGKDIRTVAKEFAKDEMEKIYLERLREKAEEIETVKTQSAKSLEILRKEWVEEMRMHDEESRAREEKSRQDFENRLVEQEKNSLRTKILGMETDLSSKKQLLSIAKSNANFQYGFLRLVCGFVLLGAILFWVYKVYNGDWDYYEPKTYLLGLTPIVIQVLVMMVLGKSFYPLECLQDFWRYRYRIECAKYSISDDAITKLENHIEENKEMLIAYDQQKA